MKFLSFILFICILLILSCEKDSPTEADDNLDNFNPRGYWSGDNIAFSVSPDNKWLCGMTMSWSPSACGLLAMGTTRCYPIDNNFHFLYDYTFSDGYNIKIDGSFDLDTLASGTWIVKKSFCSDSGGWSASAKMGTLHCDQNGSVEMCAWIDHPTPDLNISMVVYAQLLDNGIAQKELPMRIVFTYETETDTCETDTRDIGVGYCGPAWDIRDNPIKIDVRIEYKDQFYTITITPEETQSERKLPDKSNVKTENYLEHGAWRIEHNDYRCD
jgi:hypothetical protein